MADLLDEMQGDTTPAPKPAVQFRRFDDIDSHRQAIYDQALKGVQERFPVSTPTHRLEVSDVQYASDYHPSKKDEKEAILSGGRLQRPIQGKVRLVENATNKVLDERSTVLAHVPHLTSRGTFVHNGTTWLARNQARLRPGVYVRKQQNGGVEAHFNTQPGTGRGFRIHLEPETGLFKLQIGQSTTRLYPLLRALGVSDDSLKQAWGDELFKANWRGVTGHDTNDLKKVVEKLGRKHEQVTSEAELPAAIKSILARTKLDPDVTELTLGGRHDTPTPDVLTNVTKKILQVAQGNHPGDNRDSQAFQSIHSAEDFFRERLKRDQVGAAQKLLWNAARTGKLDGLHSGLLTPNLHALFRGSGLMHAVEDINPYETYDLRQGVTRLGEGGISSTQSVSRDARSVQPSHFGLIDPSRAPESSNIGLDMRVTDAALKGSDGQLYVPLKNAKDGTMVPVSARQMANKVVAFPGEMERSGKKVRAMVGEQIQYVDRKKVDYVLPDATHLFSRAANMIPMAQGVKSQRLLMGARMTTQAMPLQNPEAPLVHSVDHTGQSFYDQMGRHVGAVHADKPGRVIDMSPDHITVLHDGGEKKTYELYNNYPLARKTRLHNTAVVGIGDTVQPGQLLAKSNFTDDHGRAAPGLNMRVGYLSGRGATYEDAIVVSASAAKRLASEHQYKHKLEIGPEIHSTKTADFRAIYGDKYTPDQYRKLDDDGVVRVGQTINPGDPLVVAIGKRQGRAVGALMKSPKSSHTDASQTWDHPQPGVVTDVSRTKSGVKVSVKSYEPMTVGSKMSNQYGGKGVVSAILPDDQMPHDEDGRPLEVLMSPTGIITRVNPAVLVSTLLGKVAAKTGKPYLMKAFGSEGSLADYALAEARRAGVKETETLTDPRDGRKLPGVFTGTQYLMKLHHTAESKLGARDTGSYSVDESPARGGPEGCFVARQRILTAYGYETIGHICEKRKQVQVLTFSAALNEWVYRPVTDWFTYRAKVTDLRTVEWVGPSVLGGKVDWSLQSFDVTINHRIPQLDGSYTTVGNLKVGDELVTWGVMPTAHQWSAVLGTMLGDASLTFDDNGVPYGVQFEHSVKQSAYVAWKASLFTGLGATWCDGDHVPGLIRGKPRKRVRSRHVWFRHPVVAAKVHALGYVGNKKHVGNAWIDQIDELAIAIWFIDDGSLSSNPKKRGQVRLTAQFATNGYQPDEVVALKQRIEQVLGITCGLTTTAANQQIITVSNLAGCLRLADLVARYIPADVIPGSKMWLKQYVTEKQRTTPPVVLDTVNPLVRVPVRVRDVRPYVHDKPGVEEINVYDITVDETHLYVAGSALVSNSKRVGLLDVHSLLSSGATEFLKDAKLIRGQRNDDYWRSLKTGQSPAPVRESFANKHFMNLLKAAGVNIRNRDHGKTQLSYMTDRDVDALAQHEVTNSGTYDFNSMKPVPDGLFDLGKTGGADGTRWSKLTLPAKIPNPLAQESIVRMLGLTNKKFEDVLAGKEKISGKTGPEAIEHALKSIDLPKAIEQAKQEIKSSSGAGRDAAVKKLGYLVGLQRQGLKPDELMLSRLPVLPPKYRPVLRARGVDMIHDANYLYHDLMEAGKNYRDHLTEFGNAGDSYLNLYHAAKAVSGMADPVDPKHAEQGIRGMLRFAIGVKDSPKYSRFQRKVIGNSVDTVGRSVITIEPDLDMDTIGIPEDMAWTQFRPFVISRLVRQGLSAAEAVKSVRSRTKQAEQALEHEMKERPVVYNRAPSLHRYNYVGAFAKMNRSRSDISIPQVVTKGLGADFDGDAINVHVPVSKEAVEEVKDKLFPSRNLLHPNSFDVHLEPTQEFLAGLYLASQKDNHKPPRVFATKADAMAAYTRGEIGVRDPVQILTDK